MVTLIAIIVVGALASVVFGALIMAGGKSTRDAALKPESYVAHRSDGVHCPACGALLPAKRKPANMKQMLFGGWTCPQCRVELNSSGHVMN